jgi:biotin carboxylase
MRRILLLATTTGYQTRLFGEAAERLGVQLVYATDRCDHLDDPWRDHAVPVRFTDEAGSVETVLAHVRGTPVDGIVTVGDRPVVIAAALADALGLPGHPAEAAAASRDKHRTRDRLRRAGLPVPWFTAVSLSTDPGALLDHVRYPCVVKPVALSGSRGVMRADDAHGFIAAYERLRRLLRSPEIRAMHDPALDLIQVERYIEGDELAFDGVLERGTLHPVALFDKPDPLDGPFFEETLYVTPSRRTGAEQASIVEAIGAAARALGLWHGPIHAEVRVNARGVFVLEVAARPIGGLCARAVRVDGPGGLAMPLEELLLRHALGEPMAGYRREAQASGVMMVPIPREGILRRVEGEAEARAVPHVEDVRITAKADQRLVPLPEGASYLGFIFARAASPERVEQALRAAHAELRFVIDPALPVH